jgi:transcriptional regulator with XRE-family HTH domain
LERSSVSIDRKRGFRLISSRRLLISYLWELENRDTRKPSAEKLTKIAEALSVTTDYLLDDSAEPGEEVVKEAFFRKLSKLEPGDRRKIEQLVDMWRKKD